MAQQTGLAIWWPRKSTFNVPDGLQKDRCRGQTALDKGETGLTWFVIASKLVPVDVHVFQGVMARESNPMINQHLLFQTLHVYVRATKWIQVEK